MAGQIVPDRELVRRLAREMDCDEATARAWFDATFEVLMDAFARGERPSIRNFGSFFLREGRESTAFKFNPSQRLRMLLGWSSTYKGDL